LRGRRSDIVPLLRHFLTEFGVRSQELRHLDRQSWVDRVYNGHWHGNVRDLRSFVFRLVAIAGDPSEPEFALWAERLVEQIDIIHEPKSVSSMTVTELRALLDRHGGSRRAAARELGCSESTIRRHIARLDPLSGIDVPSSDSSPVI
jgi:DNA-binding NtrC family response regulator